MTNYAIDAENTLLWYAETGYGLSGPFNYTLTGDVNTETGYNNNLVWGTNTFEGDPIPKPNWIFINNNNDIAFQWKVDTQLYNNYLAVQDKIDALPDNASLVSSLSEKQDTATSLGQVAAIGTLSSDMVTLLSAASTAAVKTAMAFGISDVSGLSTALSGKATPTDISTAISNLVNGAGPALDTLGEIATALAADESTAAALATTVGNKVDKVSGKSLYSDADVRAVALTGLSTATNSAVTATDSVLSAMGKLQAQINDVISRLTPSISALSLSLVGTGATGTQISSTKASQVKVNISTSTTSTIGGASTSIVAIKTCATNSATESDWATQDVIDNEQTITLALALQSLQVIKGELVADLPAGYFVKLVSSGSGTHAEAFISGQKTIYG